MLLRKVKLAMTAAAVVTALAAGAVVLAQSGIGRPKDGTGKPQHVGPPRWTYRILASRDGEPPREVAVVEMTGDKPIRVDTPGALILFQPKRDEDAANPSGANLSRPGDDREHRKIVLTSPRAMDVDITERYVCQIHARRYINVHTLENGYLHEIRVKEGQAVKKGDLMFKIAPVRDKAKLDAELADARIAELEYKNAESLYKVKATVSQLEVLLFKAKYDRAMAKVALAQAEMSFRDIKAPFDGIVGKLHVPQGSLVKEGDILTTLSDNSMMWVYFKAPENRYLEYMAARGRHQEDPNVELVLANGKTFPRSGKIGAVDAQFNNGTGTIPFRADFPNPDGLLRHGQTGTILIHRKVHDAIVIPQRATFELLDKRYVYVVDKEDVAHRREIVVRNETDDIFVIAKGVGVGDRIVLEGIRQVRDGEKVEYEFRSPGEAIGKLKTHAE